MSRNSDELELCFEYDLESNTSEKIKILFGDFTDDSSSKEGEIKEEKIELIECKNCLTKVDIKEHTPQQCAMNKHVKIAKKWKKSSPKSTPYKKISPLLLTRVEKPKEVGQLETTPIKPKLEKPSLDERLIKLYQKNAPKIHPSAPKQINSKKKQEIPITWKIQPIEFTAASFPNIVNLLRKDKTIAIEGNVGCGKTTIIKMLNDQSSTTVTTISEPLNEWTNVKGVNLLQRMYDQPSIWAAIFQSYALLTMTKNHLIPTNKKLKIMERTIFSTRNCFLEAHRIMKTIDETSAQILIGWFDFMVEKFNPDVDIIIYLRTNPDVVMQRIKRRNRTEESTIDYQYISLLQKLYDDWLVRSLKPIPSTVITLNGNRTIHEILSELDKKLDIMFQNHPSKQ